MLSGLGLGGALALVLPFFRHRDMPGGVPGEAPPPRTIAHQPIACVPAAVPPAAVPPAAMIPAATPPRIVRRAINAHDAVMRFAAWMRQWEFTGWHEDKLIIETYRWFCDHEKVEAMDDDQLLSRFGASPGVIKERRRLNGAVDPGLMMIRRRLMARGELNADGRAYLYYVMTAEEMAARGGFCRKKRSRKTGGTRSASADRVNPEHDKPLTAKPEPRDTRGPARVTARRAA